MEHIILKTPLELSVCCSKASVRQNKKFCPRVVPSCEVTLLRTLKYAVHPGNIPYLKIHFRLCVCITNTKSSTFFCEIMAVCSENLTCGQNYLFL
jgi:hypothetical protein